MTRQSPSVIETAKHTEFPLIVGTCDWEPSGWDTAYYPEEMPPEWRLAFYANDFTGVLVPAGRWSKEGGACSGWLQEVPPGFRFLLEADDSAREGGEVCARNLGAAFAGWVTTGNARRHGSLAAVPLDEASGDDAPVVLVTDSDLGDQKRLGRLLVALAERRAEVVALIANGGADAEAVRRLRLLAELSGLA